MAKPVHLRRGDCVLVTSDGLVGWLIRRVERLRGEAPSYVNHVMMVVTDGTMDTAVVLDAQPPRVTLQFLREYRGSLIAIYRPRNIDDATCAAVADYAVKNYNGKHYGIAKIFLHMFGLQRFARVSEWPICSWVYTAPWAAICKLSFGKPYNEAQPDDIFDYVRDPANAASWRCVRELTIF